MRRIRKQRRGIRELRTRYVAPQHQMPRVPVALIVLTLLGLAYCQQAPPQPADGPTQFTTAPQCRCKDIEECSGDLIKKQDECKKQEQCLAYLKKIGDGAKIKLCLDKEHSTMQKVENCVKKKVNGELGCTHNEKPGNLTIPLIPLIEAPLADSEKPEGAKQDPLPPGQGPPELGQFVMCVDQCAMGDEVDFTGIGKRKKRSAVNCAFKLKCALAPPDEKMQRAFLECEKELGINPENKMKESCGCLKDAGVNIQCP